MRQPFLQIAVRGSDEHQIRKFRFQPRGRVDLPRDAAERIFGRLVPVDGRKKRRTRDVRVVVRAARRKTDPSRPSALEMRQQRASVVERASMFSSRHHAEARLSAGRLLRHAHAVGALSVRNAHRRSTPARRCRGQAAALRIAAMISVMNRMRFRVEPPYLPGRVVAPSSLVSEIAVARLRVDELIAAVVGEPCRGGRSRRRGGRSRRRSARARRAENRLSRIGW